MSRLKCYRQNCTSYSRCERSRGLHSRKICSLFLFLKLRAISSVLCRRLCSVSQFVFDTWGLWWWWILDLAVDLLLSAVGWTCYSCFACCFVWWASHCSIFINIEIHLSLVGPLNKFIDIFLWFNYVIRVSSSVAKFGIICKFRHFVDNVHI